MTTSEAFDLWKRIAAGEKGPELDAFVQQVAASMVADIFPAGRFAKSRDRAPAALKAVGFFGRVNEYAEVHRLAQQFPDASPRALQDGLPLVLESPLNPQKTAQINRQVRKARKRP
jgi:hypothetical protein